MSNKKQPDVIIVRGARVHNLKNIDIDIPLGKLVGIAGVSGSGKSSLALGTLYAEGSRRYLDALSTYTRRRITQAGKANVDVIRHVPSALALHQRPAVPGVRSTFGTASELLNSLRLMFSRLGSHACPNGHLCPPSMDVALMMPTKCPVCGEEFYGPGAEDMAFNSRGACETCEGTGTVRTINEDALIPDKSLTIEAGAVRPWKAFGLVAMPKTAEALGVRIDVPFKDLTDQEKDIVMNGEECKRMIVWHSKNGKVFELNCTYWNAHRAAQEALRGASTEKGLDKIRDLLTEGVCPDCHGTRLSAKIRSTKLMGIGLDEATAMTLDDLIPWVKNVPANMPEEMQDMAASIAGSFLENAKRLKDLGLGYLSLDRASSTLSTGERQRVQLARAVRNETTGVLYVLDEPSIGLHPSNIDGLMEVVDSLIADGNSVVLVDHDVRIMKQVDHLIEMGPLAGRDGGQVIAKGTVDEVLQTPGSKIAPFIAESESVLTRKRFSKSDMFSEGSIHIETNPIHTVKPLSLDIPKGRLVTVTGPSGSGKTTLVLEALIPGLTAKLNGERMPKCVKSIDAEGIRKINLIDSTPIGINVRSTVATYSGILDELRKEFAKLDAAKAYGYKAADFSYNTGNLKCPTCDGTGQISLDVQFLPDVTIPCPDCEGHRYKPEIEQVKYVPKKKTAGYSMTDLLAMTVDEAQEHLFGLPKVKRILKIMHDLGLGYLMLGEDTPALSGGESQRLKLASEMGKEQDDAIFVFDEPSIGLHPLDVQLLLKIFDDLVRSGATVIVIEHDLDIISNSDYLIDMGPEGGEKGGRIVFTGTAEEIVACGDSLTSKYVGEIIAK